MMGMRRRLGVFGAAALTLAALSATAVDAAPDRGPDREPKADVVLTLLHNNDGESALFESAGADGQSYGGIAPFASVVGDLKASATTGPPLMPGAKRVELMVSSGDNFLAGAAFQASLDRGVPYYDAIGMSLIGYDASAIGNHEFDFGPDVFGDFVTSFSPPLTFASVSSTNQRSPTLCRHGCRTPPRSSACSAAPTDGSSRGRRRGRRAAGRSTAPRHDETRRNTPS